MPSRSSTLSSFMAAAIWCFRAMRSFFRMDSRSCLVASIRVLLPRVQSRSMAMLKTAKRRSKSSVFRAFARSSLKTTARFTCSGRKRCSLWPGTYLGFGAGFFPKTSLFSSFTGSSSAAASSSSASAGCCSSSSGTKLSRSRGAAERAVILCVEYRRPDLRASGETWAKTLARVVAQEARVVTQEARLVAQEARGAAIEARVSESVGGAKMETPREAGTAMDWLRACPGDGTAMDWPRVAGGARAGASLAARAEGAGFLVPFAAGRFVPKKPANSLSGALAMLVLLLLANLISVFLSSLMTVFFRGASAVWAGLSSCGKNASRPRADFLAMETRLMFALFLLFLFLENATVTLFLVFL
mmetsp:Transcript_43515/g.93197  ORF Transcript_43515/g.93197 Transcript_43515/m.93197 type:complete len:358 (+) Transcript_43515:812-1885(+)